MTNLSWTRNNFEKLVNSTVDRSLADFKVSSRMGFLADSPIKNLPLVTGNLWRDKYFMAIEHIASNLPYFIGERKVAELVKELPTPNWPVDDLPEKVAFHLMLDTAIVAHADFRERLPYKNIGELVADKSNKHMPAPLAVVLWKLHKLTGIEPSMSYCLYSLWNYKILDPDKPFDIDNIELIRSFTGSLDESWFVRIHQMMEFVAVPTYKHLLRAEALSSLIHLIMPGGDEKRFWVEQMTDSIWAAVSYSVKVVNVLNRMRENCDYQTYFKNVRMFYGFPQNVIFDGVEELAGEPQGILGETGGHAVIMQFWNFTIGLNLDDIEYFPTMRKHMRREHRNLVERMKGSNIRNIVLSEFKEGNRRPANAYNAFLNSIIDWREEHLRDVDDYIGKYNETHGSGKPDLSWLNKLLDRTKKLII